MGFIRREWTPAAADEWTKEDWLAIFFSAISYIGLMIGTALSLLLLPVGFIILAIGIGSALLMAYIINPKLNKISSEYEKKQKEYLEYLERTERWEELS
jgi:uncharacterized membrane protein YgaE (UPF0421/DUF939 family)